ncbi:ParB/RepB/Spo0J family partition protein [Patescibacteria group bacterium]|nr:ParB/RepB/Spo0J family partition protein [Patescibacteria group bacterium]
MQQVCTISISAVVVEDRIRQALGDIDGLAESIKSKGQLQNIVVVKQPDGKYRLLAGGRRFQACINAGLAEVVALVYSEELSPLMMKEIELEENIQRLDLSWDEACDLTRQIHDLKTAIATEGLTNKPRWSLRDTGTLLGESKSTVLDDINLSRALESSPELRKLAKSKKEAQRLLASSIVKGVSAEIATRVEELKTKSDIMNIADSFIVGDFLKEVKSLPNSTFDFIDLDPPWGVDLANLHPDKDAKESGYTEVPEELQPELIANCLREGYRVLKPDSWLILWHRTQYCSIIMDAARAAGFNVSKTYVPAIWFKPIKYVGPRVRGAYERLLTAYETIYHLPKGKAPLQRMRSNVFYIVPSASDGPHIAAKPVPLMEDIISTLCRPMGLVLVPFLGSGNTLIASYNQGKKAIGYDLSQDFKNDFIRRLASIKDKTEPARGVSGMVSQATEAGTDTSEISS